MAGESRNRCLSILFNAIKATIIQKTAINLRITRSQQEVEEVSDNVSI